MIYGIIMIIVILWFPGGLIAIFKRGSAKSHH
jgi:ABC-type branched-subunit amino acid transport system permease subunit